MNHLTATRCLPMNVGYSAESYAAQKNALVAEMLGSISTDPLAQFISYTETTVVLDASAQPPVLAMVLTVIWKEPTPVIA